MSSQARSGAATSRRAAARGATRAPPGRGVGGARGRQRVEEAPAWSPAPAPAPTWVRWRAPPAPAVYCGPDRAPGAGRPPRRTGAAAAPRCGRHHGAPVRFHRLAGRRAAPPSPRITRKNSGMKKIADRRGEQHPGEHARCRSSGGSPRPRRPPPAAASTPRMNANDVMRIGRSRSRAACDRRLARSACPARAARSRTRRSGSRSWPRARPR